MSLFRIEDRKKIVRIESTTFEANEMQERKDLQNMLKTQIEVIAPEILIVAEEFGEWEDSHRRIDLLGVDKDANLVVIELKRTEDGGHMELQALRYAAMISALTLSRLIEIYEDFLTDNESEISARQHLLEFLGWEDVDEDLFGDHVRIVLVSADFSKELCTSVMWLNDFGLDIQCVRIAPYTHNDEILLDVQTVIPLPEVADYQVRIREKKKAQEAQRSSKDYTKYNVSIAEKTFENLNKRQMMFRIVAEMISCGNSPEDINAAIPVKKSNLFVGFDGELDASGFIEMIKAEKGDQTTKLYFIRDGALFRKGGKTYALTNQWGKDSVEKALGSLKEAYPGIGISYEPVEQTA